MVEFIDYPLITPNRIQARLYQQFLFAQAVKQNTLIILPTGLGKTVIMIMIAARFANHHSDSQIIVIAPTRPLVEQHRQSFQSMLNIPEDEIIILAGDTPPNKRKTLWDKAKIVICTPQTLRNDVISQNCDLDKISLLCIDEVHRAVGDDPYVFPTLQYLKKNKNAHVVGFTASPGKKEKLMEILQNTGIKSVQHMDEKHSLVKDHIYGTSEEWIRVALPEEFLNVLNLLKDAAKIHLTELKSIGAVKSIQLVNNSRREILKIPTTLSNLRDQIEESEFFAGMGAYGQLMLISQAIEMLETQGIITTAKYLEAKENEFRQSRKNSLRKFLQNQNIVAVKRAIDDLIARNIRHPKLDKLMKLVSYELKRKQGTRILIFSNYKSTTSYLVNEINSLDSANAHRFVGQTSNKYGKGLSQKEQSQVMADFKRGKYNILISTSVGEEGLDVAQCDLVIFYDVTPSSTRLIQRSGRTGRARKGRVVILITTGTREEGYFYASQRQRNKISAVVKEVQQTLENNSKGTKTSLSQFFDTDGDTRAEEQSTVDKEKLLENNEEVKQGIAEDSKNREDVFLVFTSNNEKIRIYFDFREKGSIILNNLLDLGIDLQQVNLPVGDFVLSDDVGVERKTIQDFCSTLKRNELFDQLKGLKNAFSKPIVILEGANQYECSLSKAAIQGAIAAIIVDFQIPVLRSSDAADTVELLYTIAKREQRDTKKKPKLRKSVNTGNIIDEQLHLIASLPNVDKVLAERLLSKFKSPRNIISAHPDDLRKVKGIGPQKADRIDILLSTPFDELEDSE